MWNPCEIMWNPSGIMWNPWNPFRIMWNPSGIIWNPWKELWWIPCSFHLDSREIFHGIFKFHGVSIWNEYGSIRQNGWALSQTIPYGIDGIHMEMTWIPPGIHLECGGTVKTSLGNGYGFWVGDFHLTCTHTCPTHTRLPARVRKPMTSPRNAGTQVHHEI